MAQLPRRPRQMPPEPSAIATLAWVARAQAVAQRFNAYEAEQFLAANRAPEQAQRIFKTALGAGTTTSSTLGTPFEGIAIGPFSDSMRTASAFYRILSDSGFTRIPMQRRVGMVTSAP